jgi:hypothetical protein
LNSSWDYGMDSMTDLTMEVSMDKMKEDLSDKPSGQYLDPLWASRMYPLSDSSWDFWMEALIE